MAQPAPATPIFNTRMVKKSSATLSMEENSRKNSGVVLSPNERMVQDKRLYR